MSIAVIVVNYGIAELVENAVESVISQTRTKDIEVHVVDNASPGNEVEKLRKIHIDRGWGHKVVLWPEIQNHGFGEGNNVVLRSLATCGKSPEFVFLLNPDTRVENDAVEELAKALETNPKAAAAGAGLRASDGKPVTAAFRFPGMISELNRTIGFGPILRMLRKFSVPLPPNHAAGSVDWVSGAAVMFRFQAIQDVNFFDPGFFLYYEEVDLMRRLHLEGWETLYVPAAQILHLAGASTGVRFAGASRHRDPPYLYQSWLRYFTKSMGRSKALILALLLIPAGLLHIIQIKLRGRPSSLPMHFFGDHWRYVVRPLISNRPVS